MAQENDTRGLKTIPRCILTNGMFSQQQKISARQTAKMFNNVLQFQRSLCNAKWFISDHLTFFRSQSSHHSLWIASSLQSSHSLNVQWANAMLIAKSNDHLLELNSKVKREESWKDALGKSSWICLWHLI